MFQQLGTDPDGTTCKAIKGLIEEGQEMINAKGNPGAIHAGLIGAAQLAEQVINLEAER